MNNTKLGVSIRLVRENRYITESDLAHMSNITLRDLRQFEMGARNPEPPVLERICIALDVPLIILQLFSIEVENLPDWDRRMIYTLKDMIVNMYEDCYEGIEELIDNINDN